MFQQETIILTEPLPSGSGSTNLVDSMWQDSGNAGKLSGECHVLGGKHAMGHKAVGWQCVSAGLIVLLFAETCAAARHFLVIFRFQPWGGERQVCSHSQRDLAELPKTWESEKVQPPPYSHTAPTIHLNVHLLNVVIAWQQ